MSHSGMGVPGQVLAWGSLSHLFFGRIKKCKPEESQRETACLFAQNKAKALDQCSNLHVQHPLPNSLLQPNSPSLP